MRLIRHRKNSGQGGYVDTLSSKVGSFSRQAADETVVDSVCHVSCTWANTLKMPAIDAVSQLHRLL